MGRTTKSSYSVLGALPPGMRLLPAGGAIRLAGTSEIQQEPWRPEEDNPGAMVKQVSIGEGPENVLHFRVIPSNFVRVSKQTENKLKKNGLSGSYDFNIYRGEKRRQDMTEQGGAAQFLSHGTHALKEFISTHRPSRVVAIGANKSKQKAYYHVFRRLAADPELAQEYKFYGRPDNPYFRVLHKLVADDPRNRGFQSDEEIVPRSSRATRATSNLPPGMNESAPLELAGTDSVQQPPWEEIPKPKSSYQPDVEKTVPLGHEDELKFHAGPDYNRENMIRTHGKRAEEYRELNRLSHPHTFLFTRRYRNPASGQMVETTDIIRPRKPAADRKHAQTSGDEPGGKAGLVMSHAVEAIRRLIRARRPMAVKFTAAEKSRIKLYEHLARRAISGPAEEGVPAYSVYHNGKNDFALVHNGAAAALPELRKMLAAGRMQKLESSKPKTSVGTANLPPGMRPAEPLELAGRDPVEQEPWKVQNNMGEPWKVKTVRIGEGPDDILHFMAAPRKPPEFTPELEEIQEQHGLDDPHSLTVLRGRRMRYNITGEGKAPQFLSHGHHAIRELLQEHRPVSVTFSAEEPSRQRLYYRIMRSLAKDPAASKEYRFYGSPEHYYFHIVHKAVAGRAPMYDKMGTMEISGEPEAKATVALPPGMQSAAEQAIGAANRGDLPPGMLKLADEPSEQHIGPKHPGDMELDEFVPASKLDAAIRSNYFDGPAAHSFQSRDPCHESTPRACWQLADRRRLSRDLWPRDRAVARVGPVRTGNARR